VRAFLVLVKLRLLDVTRRPLAGFFILILPVILLLVAGGVFSGGHPFERRRVSVLADEASFTALARLPGLRVARAASERAARGGLSSRMTDVVVLPGPQILVRPTDELLGRGLAAALPGASLTIFSAPRFGYLHYLFPGMLALAVVLTGLYGMGLTMVRYRASQLLKKLATTPLPRSTFVAAQISARTVLVLAQTALMALAARLVFGMPLSPASFAWLLALTTLGLFTFMGVGFSLACVIRVETNMQDLINALTGPVVLLSEIFFSADELPGPLAAVAAALPSTQLVRLTRAVLLEGETALPALAPGLAALVMWALFTFGLSLAVFRWHE
jgi:ABC-type multidrug transport system permease subunit